MEHGALRDKQIWRQVILSHILIRSKVGSSKEIVQSVVEIFIQTIISTYTYLFIENHHISTKFTYIITVCCNLSTKGLRGMDTLLSTLNIAVFCYEDYLPPITCHLSHIVKARRYLIIIFVNNREEEGGEHVDMVICSIQPVNASLEQITI